MNGFYYVLDEDLDIFEDVARRMGVPLYPLIGDAEDDAQTVDNRESLNAVYMRIHGHGGHVAAVKAETLRRRDYGRRTD